LTAVIQDLTARALSAWGFDVAIGFLHTVQESRASLAYDAVELFRASIDARILSFLDNNTFRREDFGLTRSGVIRLMMRAGSMRRCASLMAMRRIS
jgi:CRISPR-associated protein Cas1